MIFGTHILLVGNLSVFGDLNDDVFSIDMEPNVIQDVVLGIV